MLVVSEGLRVRSQGAFRVGMNSVRFCLWAPHHKSVTLVLDGLPRDMDAESDGYFACELSEIAVGTRYAYRLGESTLALPDPASR